MSVSDRLRKMAKKLVTRILPSYFAPNAENAALPIYMKAFLQNKRFVCRGQAAGAKGIGIIFGYDIRVDLSSLSSTSRDLLRFIPI